MDISNIDIVLIDHLYNYENIYDNSLKNTLYFELKCLKIGVSIIVK